MAGRGVHTTDEAVEYRLFPSVPNPLDARECEKYLEEQLDAYMAHLSPYLVGHIWQEQPFSLNVMSTQTGWWFVYWIQWVSLVWMDDWLCACVS